MTGLVQRLRAVSATMLIAAWALGTAVLPVVHPCPATNATLVEATVGVDHGAHDAEPAPAPASHEHRGGADCTCLGSCHVPAAFVIVNCGFVARAAVAAPEPRLWSSTEGPAPAAHQPEFLPPSTAPPTA